MNPYLMLFASPRFLIGAWDTVVSEAWEPFGGKRTPLQAPQTAA